MKRVVIISIILIATLSGCIDTETKTEYHYQNNTLKLFKDNTFIIHFEKNNRDYSGVYRIEGDNLYLVYPYGFTEPLKRCPDGWIDKDGWKWV